jgi:phosphatidylglycerol:prolipoprotein diacylglycerol transferase
MASLAYIYINIDPVILNIGPIALRWYGLMYVIGIVIALWAIRWYTARKGIKPDMVYRLLWWCVVAGLIGGRLYFVVQQPNFVSYYLAHPEHILATWEGGMAFFGAIFLVVPILFWRAWAERINPLVALDAGGLFAATGQIFGRIGNIINGDIVGYRSTLPWATIYQNKHSFFCMNLPDPSQCGSVATAVQPAAAYELLSNIVLLIILFALARRLRRPGMLILAYLYGYVITQFLLFFVRDNVIVSFLGLNWGLKQAQWTSLVVFIVLLPITYLVYRYSKPVPEGAVAATYGIRQKPGKPAGTSDTIDSVDTVEVSQSTAQEKVLVAPKAPEQVVQAVKASPAEADTLEPVEANEDVEEDEDDADTEPKLPAVKAKKREQETEENGL